MRKPARNSNLYFRTSFPHFFPVVDRPPAAIFFSMRKSPDLAGSQSLAAFSGVLQSRSRGVCRRSWFTGLLIVGSVMTAIAQSPQPVFQPDLREYGWVEFGGAIISDLDGRFRGPSVADSSDTDVRVSLSPGFAVSGGFGERFTPSFIAEIQGGLFYHNIDQIRISPAGRWSVDANLLQVPIMLNLVFEVPLRYSLKPFVGAGVGAVVSWLDMNDNLPGPEGVPGPRVDRSSTEVNFAYQGFTGLRLQLARQGVLALTYRAVAGGNPQWTLKERDTGQSVGSLRVEDVLVHSVTLGFMVPF
jgi:opacity protein-like surface antigen